MDMDFAITSPLVRPDMPHIRFLFVGSRLCSALPSDGPSRFRPCASLSFTSIRLDEELASSGLLNMPNTLERSRYAAGDGHPGSPVDKDS